MELTHEVLEAIKCRFIGKKVTVDTGAYPRPSGIISGVCVDKRGLPTLLVRGDFEELSIFIIDTNDVIFCIKDKEGDSEGAIGTDAIIDGTPFFSQLRSALSEVSA